MASSPLGLVGPLLWLVVAAVLVYLTVRVVRWALTSRGLGAGILATVAVAPLVGVLAGFAGMFALGLLHPMRGPYAEGAGVGLMLVGAAAGVTGALLFAAVVITLLVVRRRRLGRPAQPA